MKPRPMILAATLALAGCGSAGGFTAEDETAVRALEEAYRTAWLANDSAAVMATLAPGAVLMPAGLPPLEGDSAIRAFWWPDDGSRTAITRYDITVHEVEGSGDLAYLRGEAELAFTYEDPGGQVSELTSHPVHLSVARRGEDGEWRIVRRAWSALPAPTPQTADTTASVGTDTAAAAVARPLQDEAEAILAFLRGERPLDPELVADTVTLLVAPEGGGGRARVAGRELVERTRWRVGRFTLLPPDGLTRRVIRPGSHLNCTEVPLASRYPALAELPHVAVGLAPQEPGSCLRTWNVTLVFQPSRDDHARAPRLTAVVYDQWEW